MTSFVRMCAATFAALLFMLGTTAPLGAQGVTTAAISGTVTDKASGQGVESAQIEIRNDATGVRYGVVTREGGHYFVQGIAVGGPYTVTVRRIGYQPDTRQGITLSLGQNFVVDFALAQQATQLSAVTVEAAEAASTFSPAHKGTETFIGDSALRRLPTLTRNFTDFLRTSPQVTSAGPGQSAGGVNNRFNNIQIDGASENDLFGLGSTGQPGGQADGKSISLEAVKEYQILLAPYDVRQGEFNGAIVNAVTKSGTNEFHGSAFYYFKNANLAAPVPFIRTSDFDVKQFGFSLGGPIIKDRLQFFVAPEFQQRSQPAIGPYIGQGAGAASPPIVDDQYVTRFQNDLKSYGLVAGSGGLQNNTNPLSNIFGRIDLALPEINSRLVLRHNYGKAEEDIFSRSSATVFPLTSNAYRMQSTKNGTVLQLFTNFTSGADNELSLGYTTIRDRRAGPVSEPQITVVVPGLQSSTVSLVAGTEQFSQGNTLDQDMFELTDNYTFPVGQSHRVTVGARAELFKFRNLFTESSLGVWSFDSLAAFEQGIANTYRLSQDLGGGVVANVRGGTYSGYAEDNFQVSKTLSLTYGLRVDIPTISNRPAFTQKVLDIFGRRTDEVPSGNAQWSPRLGFNWDVSGDRTSQIRGGIGVFVGRPAYVWVANSFQNSGSGVGFLNCSTRTSDPGFAPPFDASVTSPPNYCINRTDGSHVTLGSNVYGPVNLMSKNLKYPQVMRASLAYDRDLGNGLVFTLEGLYTKGLNNFFYINRNIDYAKSYVGPHGRPMYGTLTASGSRSGVSNPFVLDTTRAFSEVIDIQNQSKDYAYNLSAQVSKRFTTSYEMRAAYTYSRSYDVQSLTSSRAISNWRFGRDMGTVGLLDPQTAPSAFDQPHKVSVSGTYTMPWKTWRTDLSLIYSGQSGSTFDYIYGGFSGRGDLNADGNADDMIYVPKNTFDPTEVQFATIPGRNGGPPILASTQAVALDNLITSTPCLRDQRGQIMTRNSCRNPWQNFLDMSLVQSLPSISGRTFSLRMDIFNLPNLINREWGRVHASPGGFSDVSLLTHVGMSADDPTQPVVQYNPTFQQFPISNSPSNYYQIQLSARVAF